MSMIEVAVGLQGISPLLMHAFPMVKIPALEKRTPNEQAEYAAYRHPQSKKLIIPGVAVQRALVNAATYSKGKGRASLQKPVAACVMVDPEYISLGTDKYVVDSRPVVVPATGGRVLRHRPRLNEWACEFTIKFDDALISEVEMRKVVDDACSLVGFLDFRPECKGPFGRAIVVEWKMIGGAKPREESK